MRYLINMTYDGSKYYGYQIQKNKNTVQGELEKILSKIFNEQIKTTGSSRTDKGVHALNQFCHFDTDKKMNTSKLKNSINKLSSTSLYIKNIKQVSDEFHARYNVEKKTYIYKINLGEYNPIEKDYVLQYNKNIDKELLNIYCSKISGTHNFKSFTSDKDKQNYERTVNITYTITKKILTIKFESTGFLRYMIRNIIGLLLDIDISNILPIFNTNFNFCFSY